MDASRGDKRVRCRLVILEMGVNWHTRILNVAASHCNVLPSFSLYFADATIMPQVERQAELAELLALVATAGRLVWQDALRRARPSNDRS